MPPDLESSRPCRLPIKSCHNCRRNRLRCDRSLPDCHKCSIRREHCLGYGTLLRWAEATHVRGKVQDQIDKSHHHDATNLYSKDQNFLAHTLNSSVECSIQSSLLDPLVQDFDQRHRLYINHFSNSVCQDLVSFDQQNHTNPFRSTITLLGEYDFLREIVLATAAIHIVTLRRCRGLAAHQERADALVARGRAYRLLRQALAHLGVASQRAVVMISVVFFINFDLIDSGQGSWMPHIEAAGKLAASIQSMNSDIPPFISQLADVTVADSLSYHILGSALSSVENTAIGAFEAIDMTWTLQKAAVYSYHCCPPLVLGILARACKLSVEDVPDAMALVGQLRSFDVAAWVYSLAGLPTTDDLTVRVSMASAHRAAACLYLILVVPRASKHLAEHVDATSLMREIFGHITFVPIDHPLAKGLIWPTFLAGAQADDPISRQWCLQRLQTMWRSTPWICPWGYIESAVLMLQNVWEARDRKVRNGAVDGLNWLQELRGLKTNCLIV